MRIRLHYRRSTCIKKPSREAWRMFEIKWYETCVVTVTILSESWRPRRYTYVTAYEKPANAVSVTDTRRTCTKRLSREGCLKWSDTYKTCIVTVTIMSGSWKERRYETAYEKQATADSATDGRRSCTTRPSRGKDVSNEVIQDVCCNSHHNVHVLEAMTKTAS